MSKGGRWGEGNVLCVCRGGNVASSQNKQFFSLFPLFDQPWQLVCVKKIHYKYVYNTNTFFLIKSKIQWLAHIFITKIAQQTKVSMQHCELFFFFFVVSWHTISLSVTVGGPLDERLASLLTYLIENAVGQTHGDRMQGLIMIAECVHIPETGCRKYNRQHIAYSHSCR